MFLNYRFLTHKNINFQYFGLIGLFLELWRTRSPFFTIVPKSHVFELKKLSTIYKYINNWCIVCLEHQFIVLLFIIICATVVQQNPSSSLCPLFKCAWPKLVQFCCWISSVFLLLFWNSLVMDVSNKIIWFCKGLPPDLLIQMVIPHTKYVNTGNFYSLYKQLVKRVIFLFCLTSTCHSIMCIAQEEITWFDCLRLVFHIL